MSKAKQLNNLLDKHDRLNKELSSCLKVQCGPTHLVCMARQGIELGLADTYINLIRIALKHNYGYDLNSLL